MNKKIIPLTRDFMFSEIFNNPGNISILETFLSAYLEIPKKVLKGNIKILSRRLPNESKSEARKEVDVLLKLKDKKIIIEMNANDFYQGKRDRNLVYASKVLSGEYKKSDEDYSGINKVHQINFVTKDTKINKRKPENLINEYELRDKNNPEQVFSKKLQIDIISMEKSKDKCYTYLNEREKITAMWCRLMYTESLEEFLKEGRVAMEKEELNKLTNEVEKLSEDDEMIRLESDYTVQERTYKSNLKEIAEELREEIAEEKYEEGKKNTQIETVKRMHSKGLSDELISEYTGISEEEINNIIKETKE